MADLLIPRFDSKAFGERLKKAIKAKDVKGFVALDAEITSFVEQVRAHVRPHLPASPKEAPKQVWDRVTAQDDQRRIETQNRDALRLRDTALGVWGKRPRKPIEDQIPIIAPLSSGPLADAYACIETAGKQTRFVFLHPRDFADIRKDATEESRVDWAPQAIQVGLGLMGVRWAAWLVMSETFERGTVWLADATGRNWSSILVTR